MVYPVGVIAALFLGIGYVLQQRVAAQAALEDLLSLRLLLFLMKQRIWWVGMVASVIGSVLGGLALQLASVSTVEPLLSASLLFALVTANVLSHHRTCWQELGGAVLVTAALTVFLAVGRPRASSQIENNPYIVLMAVGAAAGLAAVLVIAGKLRGLVGESVLLALAAGVLSGLQDAGTRAALVDIDDHGVLATVMHPWIYLVAGGGLMAILLSQSAFKAARLDYSLPPLTVAEPLVGIALGVTLLGDRLSVTPTALGLQSACLVLMAAGVVLIGRSPSLAEPRRGALVRLGRH